MLLERCVAGDRQAWDKLVHKYEKCVYRFAFALCRNRDDAADIASTVFVRVFQSLHTFRREASFSSWLFRIVHNTHLDLCVRPNWRNAVSLDALVEANGPGTQMRELSDTLPSPEQQSIDREVSRLLSRALRYMPAYQREVLSMYHAQGKSYEQIAEATGLSIGTVKSRLNRARSMLRDRLTPQADTFLVA